MIPIRDDNPQINRPYGVYALIVVNVVAWLLLQGAGQAEQLYASICQFGLVPADLSSTDFIGAGQEAICPANSSLGWAGTVSSMFMHGGWMHIIGNMWFLWIFGDNVEDAMGTPRFLVFYVLCGLAAAAAQTFSNLESIIPMVGASGAIGGVMGAYIVLYPKVKVHLLFILLILFFRFRVPAILMLGYWALIQIVGGFTSIDSTEGGTAFWAHLGGFVAGALLVLLFKDDDMLKSHPYYGWD